MEERIKRLRRIIMENIVPMITGDYILIDLPYYLNVGDILIWEGTEQLLNTIQHSCLERASFQTFSFRPFHKDVIILMQGGGNFGDLYPWHADFRRKVIEAYPDNRIIILPQTVYYEKIENAVRDANIFQKHGSLTLCARDEESFHFLQRFSFAKDIRLLPDMAFCMDLKTHKSTITENEKALLLLRNDGECPARTEITKQIEETDYAIHDWFDNNQFGEIGMKMLTLLNKAQAQSSRNCTLFQPRGQTPRLKKCAAEQISPEEVNLFAYEVFRPWMLKHGIELLSNYSRIYTTRLHAAILGILLNKDVVPMDNNYGKISHFYSAWLEKPDVNLKPTFAKHTDITIILPVYNVAEYIEECLHSIVNQDYQGSIECLIIDDCGQDASTEIAQKIINEYHGNICFRVIFHTRNRGLSAARNTGLLEATGDYIFFMDSDDRIAPDCLSKLMKKAQASPEAQMVMGGVEKFGDDTSTLDIASEGLHRGDALDQSCRFLIYTMAWNKLIPRNFILENKLFFVEGLLHEDVLWYIQVAHYLTCYEVTKDITYYYRVRKNSIQTTESAEFHSSHLMHVCRHLYKFIFEQNLEENKQLRQFVMNILVPLLGGKQNLLGWKVKFKFYRWLHHDAQCYKYNQLTWLNSKEKRLFGSFRLPSLFGYLYYRYL